MECILWKFRVHFFYRRKKKEEEKVWVLHHLLHETAIFCIRNYIMKETSFQGKYVKSKAVPLGDILINLNAVKTVKLEYLKDLKGTSFFPLF